MEIVKSLLILAIFIVVIAGMWKMYVKAGQPGWAVLVPIYNIIVLIQIAKKPVWWIVLFLIPIVSLIAMILVSIEIAKNFGKPTSFAIGLILLPFVFYPILGFGDAQYQK